MLDDHRKNSGRRKEDCLGKCIEIEEIAEKVQKLEGDLAPLLQQALGELKTIKAQNQTQLEIMAAWNNAKGFVKGMQLIGKVTKWIAGVAAAIGMLWGLIHYGGKS